MVKAMKKIIVALSSSSSAMRDCIVGIFNYVNSGKDWDVQLVPFQQETEDLRKISRVLSKKPFADIDGIITGVVTHPKEFDDLVRCGIPLVLNNHPADWAPPDGAPITILHDDNIATGKMGAHYLHSKGRFRAYGFVRTSVKCYWETFRHRGFNLGLAKWGITPFSHEVERDDFDDWLRRLPKPAAVMAACDATASNTIETCHRLKIRIPEQVAVLGVDNDEFFCKAIRPQISSIQTNNVQMGERAAAELDRLMRTGKPGKTFYIKPEKVVERDSTRAVPPAGHLIDSGLAFIRENYQNGITARDVARHLGVSEPLLRLRFRSILEKPVRDILIKTRIEKAKRLLADSDKSISQIAREIGFASIQRFSHCFAERLSLSPSDWRQQNLRGASRSVP